MTKKTCLILFYFLIILNTLSKSQDTNLVDVFDSQYLLLQNGDTIYLNRNACNLNSISNEILHTECYDDTSLKQIELRLDPSKNVSYGWSPDHLPDYVEILLDSLLITQSYYPSKYLKSNLFCDLSKKNKCFGYTYFDQPHKKIMKKIVYRSLRYFPGDQIQINKLPLNSTINGIYILGPEIIYNEQGKVIQKNIFKKGLFKKTIIK
jgi:hypothetical protein